MHSIVGVPEFRGRLFVADHIEGELLSVLNKNFRRGILGKRGLGEAREEFYTHYPSIFAVVPPRPEIAEDALHILNRYAQHDITHPDALHLAAARYVAATLPAPDLVLVTSDGPLLAVANRVRVLLNPEKDSLRVLD